MALVSLHNHMNQLHTHKHPHTDCFAGKPRLYATTGLRKREVSSQKAETEGKEARKWEQIKMAVRK